MNYPLYCWRDKYTGFSQPMPDMNDGSAKRNFAVMLNNDVTKSFSPADFDFYKIGEFDSETGVVSAKQPIEFICNGIEVYKGEE